MNRSDVTILPLNGKTPKIHPTAFIAPGCRIIGDVEIGAHSSIWYNCVIRGDISHVRIGERSNVQDGSVIHCDGPGGGPEPRPGGWPTIIGDDVLVGHMVMLHGCTIHDRGFVGLSAVVMNACLIESDAMLAAGALLSPGKTVPTGTLWAGRPARFMRELSEGDRAGMRGGADHYVAAAAEHRGAVGDFLGPLAC